LRAVWVQIRQRGPRTEVVVVVTTLPDARAYSATDLADGERLRWQADLDLRPWKGAPGMDVWRRQSPAMAGKEVWAYTLIRGVTAEAAADPGGDPRPLRFAGARQAMTAFAERLLAAEEAEFKEP